MAFEGGNPEFVTDGGQRAVDHFAKLVAGFDPQPQDLRKGADYLRNQTRARTMSGYDANYRAFAPYSPLYAKKKRSSKVDLLGKGRSGRHMLDAIDARVSLDPPQIMVGVFDDPELAMKAAVHNQGLTLTGRAAQRFIKNLVRRSHQKISGLKRQLKNRKAIVVIPKREFLKVSPQDLKIVAELSVQSVLDRLKGV